MTTLPATTAQSTLGYFRWAFIVTVIGLVLGGVLGWQMTGTIGGMATVFFICSVLAVLEISLSFDNAIVNANKLKDMTPVWQQRFLTWGIIIAVFGMRIVSSSSTTSRPRSSSNAGVLSRAPISSCSPPANRRNMPAS